MPYGTRRRFKKRRYKKRPYRKKRKGTVAYRRSSNFLKTKSIFPYLLRTSLNYSDTIQANPAAVVYSYTYNLNNIYDPDQTGTGHQPMLHDQLSVAYQRYRVRACKYSVTISNSNTPIRCCLVPYNNSGPIDLTDACEMKLAKSAIVNSMSSGGTCIRTLAGYTTLRRLLGENPSDDRDQAEFGSAPANTCRVILMVQALDGATNITSLNLIWTLTYYIECFDRLRIAGS